MATEKNFEPKKPNASGVVNALVKKLDILSVAEQEAVRTEVEKYFNEHHWQGRISGLTTKRLTITTDPTTAVFLKMDKDVLLTRVRTLCESVTAIVVRTDVTFRPE